MVTRTFSPRFYTRFSLRHTHTHGHGVLNVDYWVLYRTHLLAPHQGEKFRCMWEIVHKGSGYCAIIMSTAVISLGIGILADQETVAFPDVRDQFFTAYGATACRKKQLGGATARQPGLLRRTLRVLGCRTHSRARALTIQIR